MNREKRKLINGRTQILEKSDKRFKDIFYVIFSAKERNFAQYTKENNIVKVSVGELYEKVLRYAYFIRKDLGFKHEYIGIDSENCVEWVASFWGILYSGNKPYFVNCKHPNQLKINLIKDVDAKTVIGAKAHELGVPYVEYETIEKYTLQDDFDALTKEMYENDFEDEFALSTSATSLNETICIYTGKEMSESILNAKYVLENNKIMPNYYKGALRQLAFLPFYHIFGFSAVYMWFAYYGCTMVFMENYSGDTILKTVREHNVTHLFAVPLLWNTLEAGIIKQVNQKGEKTAEKFKKGLEISEKIQNILPYAGIKIAKWLLREVTDKTLGRSVQFCITGGANIKESTLRFFNCLGYPLHNGYGMTETGITSVCLEKNIKKRYTNTVGKPFPSIKYTILEDGELEITGSSICKERIVNGKRISTDGRFITEDNFGLSESGYYIMGRKNDLIIGADGENINPDLVEKSISVPFMQRFCIYKEITEGKEHPAMVIELKKLCTPKQIAKTIEDVEAQIAKLPTNSRPVNVYYTYDFISSPDAVKISRKFLIKGIENGTILLKNKSEFSINNENIEKFDENTELAKLVKNIIADALNKDEKEILPDANVMTDLGGSSLDYFYIMSQINEKTGISLYTDETHCPYTLREFCREIEEQM